MKENKREELKADIEEYRDSTTWWSNRFNAVERDNRELRKEISRLHSIIKEVRKYIDKSSYKIEWGDLEQDNEDININEDLTEKEFIEGLLEILDKENNNGER